MTKSNDKMYDKALKYQSNPKKHLKSLIKDVGYDTCHQIKGYDASKCHKDCKKLEKSKFAKDCKNKSNGVFKCCIRRDKEFCHECRFCCTLSVCTTGNGTYFKDSKELNNAQPLSQQLSGKAGFQVDIKLYKSPDYRCLKPIKGRSI